MSVSPSTLAAMGAPLPILAAPPQNSLLQDMYEGGCSGLKIGGKIVGAVALSLFLAPCVEVASRGLGNEPLWPISRRECQMPQFQNRTSCTREPEDNQPLTIICVFISSTTIGCATIGAVVGAVKHFFG